MTLGEVIGSIVTVIIAVLILSSLLNDPAVHDTDVYNLGYNEMNVTRYNAACEIIDDWPYYDDAQTNYAGDYKRGYEARIRDDAWNESKSERNETLRTLGYID